MRPGWFFAFFLISGFCGLVYQVVWLRLAMAAFGVTAPLVSIVLSVFMAGLALGSWGGGRVAGRCADRPAAVPLRLYALAELIIAGSGELVPRGLAWGREVLVGAAQDVAWGSLGHYVVSGFFITLVLLPFCVSMGATFPLAMAAIRRGVPDASPRSFSYLYIANVVGACAGTLVSALALIEIFGFRGTLRLAATLNAALAAGALALSLLPAHAVAAPTTMSMEAAAAPSSRRAVLSALFATGFSTMGMEVVWVRQFTPYLGTLVYAFAVILALYLAATFTGSTLYRRRRLPEPTAGSAITWSLAWTALGFLALLSLASADPRWSWLGRFTGGAVRVILGVVPLCAALGYFTPMLVDRWSGGESARAGAAYAVNMLGCILGPLAAGFALLPWVGERWSLVLLALPLFAVGLRSLDGEGRGRRPLGLLATVTAFSVAVVFGTRDFEQIFPSREVRRDYTATVIATGEGMGKQLLVNGVGMTRLTPITKLMAHLPLAFLETTPRSGLALCFGMGVTFRSLHSWGIETTAVELVPSVPPLFGYYHPGDEELLRSPRARIVIDDGRRFLERSAETYDVITIDPPPPIQAAGSSLLYSREFYEVVRKRLRPGGILQQWLPEGDATIASSFARALVESFPHVRAFSSVEGWGVHFLASGKPIARRSPAEAASRLPSAAREDLLEWGPGKTAEEQIGLVLAREIPLEALLRLEPSAVALRDDHPVNEYYLLRTLKKSWATDARRASLP